MSNRWKELENRKRALALRLKGAVYYKHPYRGFVYELTDGTFLSEADYKALRRQCLLYMLGVC